MKKLIILIAFAPLISFAQINIGYSKQEILESLSSYSEGKDSDGINFIKTEINGDFYYYLDKNGICYACQQIVTDSDKATEIALSYDKRYKIVDANTWEYKYDGATIEVMMNFNHQTKSYTFIYYEKE